MAYRPLPRYAWIIAVIFFVFSLQETSGARNQFHKPRKCDATETWFRHRRQYVYNYNMVARTGFTGTTDLATGSVLTCVVTIKVPKRCEATVELSGCKLKERGLDGRLTLSRQSRALASLLEKDMAYVQVTRGVVMGGQMLVRRNEPTYVTNIKRGIMSQLQLPILPVKEYDSPVTQHDIFGDCPMQVTVDPKANRVFTQRDLTQCRMPHVFGRQMFVPSVAKQFQVHLMKSQIDTLIYPFRSNVDCEFGIKQKRLNLTSCHQTQTFQPITYNGEMRASPTFNITQTLTLAGVGKMRRRTFISRSLNGRKVVDLEMDMEMPASPKTTSSQVHEALGNILRTYSAQSDKLPPEQFEKLVGVLRSADQSVLDEVLETLLTCRDGTGACRMEQYSGQMDFKTLQNSTSRFQLSGFFLADGLLSCGTEACLATYVACLQNKMVHYYQAELSLLNMAFFYQPAPAVVEKLLLLCQQTSSNNCWLSLGTLVGKMTQQVRDSDNKRFAEEAATAAKNVLQHLKNSVGNACRSTNASAPTRASTAAHHQKLASLMVVLKTLGNAGRAVQDLYDDVSDKGADLTTVILQCVNNSALPDKVTNIAMAALENFQIRDNLRMVLFNLLRDPSRRVSLRSIAFDRLLRLEDANTVQALKDLITSETVSSLKSYMVTKVRHLLESNDPHSKSLRKMWRASLADDIDDVLPELADMRGRGSQYAELSHYVELPLLQSRRGGRLGLGVVYQPASLMPSSFRVSVSFLLNDRSMELLEVGLDMQGMENIARVVLGPNFNPSQGMGALVAQIMQAALPKKDELPKLFFHDDNVVEALKKLLVRINLPTGDTPQAQLRIKLLGSEVGFVHLEDIMMMFQNQASGRMGLPRGPNLIQRLSEGLRLFLGKSMKMIEVVKTMPTVAGLPWHAEVEGAMVATAMLKAESDVFKFFRRIGPLQVTGDLLASVGVKVTCLGSLKIGDVTSSGLLLNISVLVNGGWTGRLVYGHSMSAKGGPPARMLQLGMGAIKRPQNIISIRSNIYQLHNGNEKAIETPSTEVRVRKCLPGFLQKWSGQSVCVEGFHQHVGFSADSPFPLTSGPVHLDVNTRSVDKALKEYTVNFTSTRQPREDALGDLIVIKANCMAPGSKLKRQFDVVASFSPVTKEVHLSAKVPEFGLSYRLDVQTSAKRSKSVAKHILVSSVMKMGSEVVHAIVVEDYGRRETTQLVDATSGATKSLNVSEMLMKFKVVIPGVTLEVVTSSTSGIVPGRYTHSMFVRYYCEPQLGVLYSLHGRPDLAVLQGHVSKWSISNTVFVHGNGVTKVGKEGESTLVVLLPGRNLTLYNQMTGDYVTVLRNTTIYWTTEVGTPNQSTEVIKMKSHVVDDHDGMSYNMQYGMTMEHVDKYDVAMNGSLVGPLTDLDCKFDISFKAKSKKRQRRSLRELYQRLKRVEKTVESAVETAEDMVVRRGAELTESFLQWLAKETTDTVPKQKQKQQQQPKKGQEKKLMPAGSELATKAGQTKDVLATLRRSPIGPKLGYLLKLFNRTEWKLKIHPHLMIHKRQPTGYKYFLSLDMNLPDLKLDIFSFNGTLGMGKGVDIDTDVHLHSELLNFTLTHFLKLKYNYPVFYHAHRWNIVEFTEHRYDCWFDLLLDLVRKDHLHYRLNTTTPITNVNHVIHFTTVDKLRLLRHDLHLPSLNIHYKERSKVTPKSMKTDLSFNTTRLNVTMDMNIAWAPRGNLAINQHFDVVGKMPLLNGTNKMDVILHLNLADKSRIPTLVVRCNNSAGHISSVIGKLANPHHVVFTFTTKPPKGKKLNLLTWDIRLSEPTALEHSLSWDRPMTKPLFNKVLRIYTAGSHSFRVFGQTVADNVYRNISDMQIPFYNTTISKAVDRVVQGHMKAVAMKGLDPKKNIPFTVKILKGGLRVVQDLQYSWQRSAAGQFLAKLGAHSVVAGAARMSTRLHYMVVQDPPFPMRQYLKFHVLPRIQPVADDHQFSFTHPLPFVWDSFVGPRHPRFLQKQKMHRAKVLAVERKSVFRFMALVSRHKIQTFDGSAYDIAVPKKHKCTYLLATDLAVGNHSVLLTHHSAILALRDATVTMDWDGTVKINNSHHMIHQLPAELNGATVNLKDGQITASVPGQLRLTYNPFSKIYFIEAAGHTHNRSVGLLGTNTLDSSDDFLLPSGQLTTNVSVMQNQYELSGNASCQYDVKTTSSSCKESSLRICNHFFKLPSSPLSSCFSVIDPSQFLDLCMHRICNVNMDDEPTELCHVMSSYVKMCDSRGHRVSAEVVHKKCGSCMRHPEGEVDVVFGSALTGQSMGDLVNVIFSMTSQLGDQARFGLVRSQGGHMISHLFDGQLFMTPKEIKSLHKLQSLPVNPEVRVKAILDAASSYPFRPAARRFIVLFVGTSTPDVTDTRKLQQALLDKGISLVLVSNDLDKQQAMAITWNKKVVCRKCDKGQVAMPTTNLGTLATSTKGMWLSLDALENGRRARLRKLMTPLKVAAKQLAPWCNSSMRKSFTYSLL